MSQNDSPSTEPAGQPAAAPAPRAITRKASRRAWAEPRVRLWWLLAAGVFLVGIYYAAVQSYDWWKQLNLIKNGVQVKAIPFWAEGARIANQKFPPGTQMNLEFTYRDKAYRVCGPIANRGEFIVTGVPVTIHIDPNDPQFWTGDSEVPPLLKQMLLLALILPLALLLLGLAMVARAGIVKCWQKGITLQAVVIASQQTAQAPRSKLILCRPVTDGDRRVFRVFVPMAMGDPQRGDTLEVIAAGEKSTLAIFAAAYVA